MENQQPHVPFKCIGPDPILQTVSDWFTFERRLSAQERSLNRLEKYRHNRQKVPIPAVQHGLSNITLNQNQADFSLALLFDSGRYAYKSSWFLNHYDPVIPE